MRNTTISDEPKWTTTITLNVEALIALDISPANDTTPNVPIPLSPDPRRESSSQKSPRPSFPTPGDKPTSSPPKPLPVSDIPTIPFPATDEVFTTAWFLFLKKRSATYHHDFALATTPQQKRNISQCFDADACILLDVYETRIQDPLWQPLGGRVFIDLSYRRFTKGVASTCSRRSALDMEKNAEWRNGSDALSVFRLRYRLARGLDRYMAGPRGFLRRAIANRDEGLADLLNVDIEMRKCDFERCAIEVYELREEKRLLEWIRNINSTEDEYWDMVDRRKIDGKRASGDEEEEEGNRKRLSEELEGTGYDSVSEIDVDDENIPSNELRRNDSVIRQQSAKEGDCFLRADGEVDADDDDYYTADERDDAERTEEENVDDQNADDRTNSATEYGWNGATEEPYGTHSDEETLAGSTAPRRSSRKGSTSSSSDEREMKEEEENEQQEIAAG
jgi:hypothetical protein